MISVIVRQGARAYLHAMASALFKLLMLAALLFMPVGMAGAPALAAPAAAAAGHCDEHPQPVEAPSKQVHCTGCAALPAIEAPQAATGMPPEPARLLVLIQPISGIEPEIATPPPKRS